MQHPKRRSRKGVILLALAFAILALAILPATASAGTAQPGLYSHPDFALGGVGQPGSQGYIWFAGPTAWSMAMSWWLEYVPASQPPSPPASYDKSIHSIMYEIDGVQLPSWTQYEGEVPVWDIPVPPPGSSNPKTFVFMPLMINYESLTGFFNGLYPENLGVSADYTSGVHTVTSWVVEGSDTAGPATTQHPISTDHFGIDREDPVWSYTGMSDGVWHGKGSSVTFNATIDDQGGSGIDFRGNATPTAGWQRPDTVSATPSIQFAWAFAHQLGYPGEIWNPWVGELSGTLNAPTALVPSGTRDGYYWVQLSGRDVVGHVNNYDGDYILFDTVAPHVVATATPDATNVLSWTNQDVTVKITATDPQSGDQSFSAPTGPPWGPYPPAPAGATKKGPAKQSFGEWGFSAGVDKVQYSVVYPTTAAFPPIPTSWTDLANGGSITISQNAPVGPVYVFYRALDKAVPANVSEVNWITLYIDKTSPALQNDVPDWWINYGMNAHEVNAAKASGEIESEQWMWIDIWGTDANSGFATPGIQFRMPTWAWPAYVEGIGLTHIRDWTALVDMDEGPDFELWFDRMTHINDGIFPLDYKASDRAGNTTSVSTEVKIDTRAPVTDGASGWVNGLVPYVLTATDQTVGAGNAATIFRVDQATPWQVNEFSAPAPVNTTSITLTGGQGATHTIDFGSVDAALPFWYGWDFSMGGAAKDSIDWDTHPSWFFGNFEGTDWIVDEHEAVQFFAGYKTRSVKLDVTAPTVTITGADDIWHNAPVTLDFSASDVGAGVDYIEYSTDGGSTWTQGNHAIVSQNGETTVQVLAVDKVGIVSDVETATVKVSTQAPSVTDLGNVTVTRNHRATFTFTVNSITPVNLVRFEILNSRGKIVLTRVWNDVAPGSVSKTLKISLKVPKTFYKIRIGVVDGAGNLQQHKAKARLFVK